MPFRHTPPESSARAARFGMKVARAEIPAGIGELLTQGGDERIWCAAATGRNRYGVGPLPASGEIWLSSSTASGVSEKAFSAVRSALVRLTPSGDGNGGQEAVFEIVRQRLHGLYGAPGCEVVLAPSGTEAELLLVALAVSLMPGPFTNIVIAPTETGSGIVRAAGGAWFLDSTSLGASVRKGDKLPGLEAVDIEVAAVEIRTEEGGRRPAGDIDAEVHGIADKALATGRSIIVHLLDTSKTGLSGFSREAARALARKWPERVLVAVDACQLRCGSDTLRRDLTEGFVTLVSGSKFAAGPPFSGALLVPEEIVARLSRSRIELAGLGCFSALTDWPARLRPVMAASLAHFTNLGLGLRWIAALDALEGYEATDATIRTAIAERFERETMLRIERTTRMAAVDGHGAGSGDRTIVPFLLLDQDGRPADMASTRRIHGRLRMPEAGPVIHIGQPVALGRSNPLRVCASASHFVDIAARHVQGEDFNSAFAPLLNDLDALFDKLDTILALHEDRG